MTVGDFMTNLSYLYSTVALKDPLLHIETTSQK